MIGKRFRSAGLRDLIVKACLGGPHQIKEILKGKHFNYGIRISKIVFEALLRLTFECFESDALYNLRASNEFSKFMKDRNSESFENGLKAVNTLPQLYEKFDDSICKGSLGPMARFWQSYLDMVQILLDFVKSTRLPSWDLHLQITKRMLLWIHAYVRINYSRHFTYYWASQQKLATKHPSILQEFQDGNFVVRRTPTKFNRLSPDLVIEQTINRHQKEPGGIIGSSTSQRSMETWALSSHNTATLIADFKRGIGWDSWKGSKDLSHKHILDDESAIIKCCGSINNWKNQFEDSDSLFSLSSGIVPSHEVEEDMFNAENIGRSRLESFIAEMIETNRTDFYANIKKNNLKTFDEQKKIATLKIQNNRISIKTDRETFARVILIQQQVRVYETFCSMSLDHCRYP